MSDLAVPPESLLTSAWRPLIVAFVQRVITTLRRGPPGVFLTSWYRTPLRNANEGGSPESQHLFGLAMDLGVEETGFGPTSGREPSRLRDAARGAGLIGVPILDRGGLHVQLFPAGTLARAGVVFPALGGTRAPSGFIR